METCCLEAQFYYQLQKNNTKHLITVCEKHGTQYHPFKDNLPLKIIHYSRDVRKVSNSEQLHI